MTSPRFEVRNSNGNPNDRLLRFLQATAEQQAAIDRILDGRLAPEQPRATGPLLLGMGDGAKLLGVSRATFWRIIKAGRLSKVEVLPGSFRVRRADVELLAQGHQAGAKQKVEVTADAEIRSPKTEIRRQMEGGQQ